MDHEEDLKYRWLRFNAESGVFGTRKKHLGFIIGSNASELFCVAVSVTSQWDSRDRARSDRGDPKETLVWIRAGSEKGSHHFAKDSVIDCAFPKRIECAEIKKMLESGKIEMVRARNTVSSELIEEVRSGIIATRVVTNIINKLL